MDEEKQFEIYDNLPKEYRERFATCRSILTNYPFSVVVVRDTELEDVCEIFERINQSGRRLSLPDLVVANTWSKDFDLREKVKELNRTLSSKGFQEIETEAVTESLALNIKGGCTRSFQLQMTTDDIKNAWEETVESLKLAVDFLRGNLGVKRYDFLPYRGIIPVLAYYFFKSNNRSISPSHRTNIEKWFWGVSFFGGYARSTQTNMGNDRVLFDRILSDEQVPLEYSANNIEEESIIDIQMHRQSAIKNAVLCLLAVKQPKHFRNNTLVPLDDKYFSDFNSPEKHHIFPVSFLKELERSSLANFCFIPAELNKEISNKKPNDYFKELRNENPKFEETMESHLIPIDEDSGIWTDDYTKFLYQRAKSIKREIKRLFEG